jgi:hypothetical protein
MASSVGARFHEDCENSPVRADGSFDRIRHEVNEQTRTMLHDGSAIVSTIEKCVSRSVGKSMKLSRSTPSLFHRGTVQVLESKESRGVRSIEPNSVFQPGGSAIFSAENVLEKNNQPSTSPTAYERLAMMSDDATKYQYDDGGVHSAESIVPEVTIASETIQNVKAANRQLRNEHYNIKPSYERLYRTRKECKIVAEASYPMLYSTLSEKQAKIKERRLQSLRRRERVEQGRARARFLGNATNMIGQQIANEAVRNLKTRKVTEAARDADQLRRHRRYVKARLHVFHERQKLDGIAKTKLAKEKVANLLRKNSKHDLKRLEMVKSTRSVLHRTSTSSFVFAETVDKYGRKREIFLPKLGERGKGNETMTRPPLHTSTICVDGYTLFEPNEIEGITQEFPVNSTTSTAQIVYEPSTSSAIGAHELTRTTSSSHGNRDGSFGPTASSRTTVHPPPGKIYGGNQPWGGLAPVQRNESTRGHAIVIPSISGAFTIGNETLEPVSHKSTGSSQGGISDEKIHLDSPGNESWKPMNNENAIAWARVNSANSRISAHGSVSEIETSENTVPIRMDVGSPFNARKHYGKLDVPLSPPFKSTGGRGHSTMYDPVIGAFPAPWGVVRPEHMVSRGKSES